MYSGAVALVMGGVVMSLTQAMLSPLLATVVGVLLYSWLFKTAPVTSYVTYLVIDERGVEYVHSPGSDRRVSRYGWHQIEEVFANLASRGEEPGLTIKTNLPHLGGQCIFLPMFSENDCLAAVHAVRQGLHEQRA